MKIPPRIEKPVQFFAATLPYKQLPDYPDIGSWRVNEDGSPAFIGAADCGNDVSNMAVLLHEIVECFLCWAHGVKEEDVRKFDQDWFRAERLGLKHISEEPGHDESCPYRDWHLVAERFEREFILQCGMLWQQHSDNLDTIKNGD